MSDIKMGEVIREIIEKPTRRQRFGHFLQRLWTKAVWTIWGRRRAFARMKKLALGQPSRYYQTDERLQKNKQQIDERLQRTRSHYDSLYVEVLPSPDSDDSGVN